MRFGNATASDATPRGAFRVENVNDGVVRRRGHARRYADAVRLPGELEIQRRADRRARARAGEGSRHPWRPARLRHRSAVAGVDLRRRGDTDGAAGRVIAAEYEVANLDAGALARRRRRERLTVCTPMAASSSPPESRGAPRPRLRRRAHACRESVTSAASRPRGGELGPMLQGHRCRRHVALPRRTSRGDAILRGLAEGVYELTATAGEQRPSSRAPWVRRIDLREDTEVAIELGGAIDLRPRGRRRERRPGARRRRENALRRPGRDGLPWRRLDAAAAPPASSPTRTCPRATFSIDATKEGYGDRRALGSRCAPTPRSTRSCSSSRASDGLRLRVAGDARLRCPSSR